MREEKHAKLDAKLEKHRERRQLVEATQNMQAKLDREERSGLILREDTRVIEERAIDDLVLGRDFAPLYDIDSFANRQTHQRRSQAGGLFTIGVLIDKSPLLTGKNGGSYCIVKLSDLRKCDVTKVKTTTT